MLINWFRYSIALSALAVTTNGSLAMAQMPIQPGFNAAIINGPAMMAWESGQNTGTHEIICGRDAESDWETKQLLVLKAAGRCDLVGEVVEKDVEASALLSKAENNRSQTAIVSSLTYNSSLARRQKNYATFLTKMRQTDPSAAANVTKLFASVDVIEQLDRMMGAVGLRSNNMADAYSVWWVAAWEAVNNRDAGSSVSMYRAVKQQASNALLASSQLTMASDEKKQEMAESLLIQAAMLDASIDMAAGNPTQQAELAKAVNQGAKKMGLDLTTMDLTENGFVPRSGKRSDASDADPAAPDGAGTQMAANDNAGANASASESDNGKLALYGVGGVALLAGMFALGKSFGGKG